MLGKLARTVFGSANDRFVKKQYKSSSASTLLNQKFPRYPMKN